ncbi:MAG: RidA family protein [Spirulinaceae cyanobacterium RM2_2_10]|nr:RidA family protein [Spirulinaceae cyanobacterium RM2_2_10]
MTKRIICTDAAPTPVGPYNQGVVASGQLLFVAGQIPLEPQTGAMVGEGDVAAQTRQAIDNLVAVLAAAGADLSQVVKTTLYLANLDDFATVNQVYGEYFEVATAPARAAVEVSRLPKGALVEIECVAALG